MVVTRDVVGSRVCELCSFENECELLLLWRASRSEGDTWRDVRRMFETDNLIFSNAEMDRCQMRNEENMVKENVTWTERIRMKNIFRKIKIIINLNWNFQNIDTLSSLHYWVCFVAVFTNLRKQRSYKQSLYSKSDQIIHYKLMFHKHLDQCWW